MSSRRVISEGMLLPLSVMFMFFFVHVYFLNRYAINIPFSDDYFEILKNMNLIMDSGSYLEKAGHLLHGNGFSKPITVRLVSLLHISLLHEINFKSLVITGNIFLLLVCLVFVVQAINVSKYLIIAAACFIFQPQYWEAIYQSTLSNSVFPCLFFSLVSIYCITIKTKSYFATSLISAVLAQISFGNGFLVYPILLAVLFFCRRFKQLLTVVFTMIISTCLYMSGSTVSYTAGEQFGLLTKFKLISLWFPEFLGSSLGYVLTSGYSGDAVGRALSIAVGVVLVLFYMFLAFKKYYICNLPLFSFYTFFIMTALLAAKLRFTTEVPGASRYQIQSALCVLTALMVMVDMYSHKMKKYIVVTVAVVFPVLFSLASYRTNLATVAGHRARLASGMWAWTTYGKGLTIWSDEEAAGRLLVQSGSRNIYKIPSKQSLIAASWNN